MQGFSAADFLEAVQESVDRDTQKKSQDEAAPMEH
jgi:hypothetical protein